MGSSRWKSFRHAYLETDLWIGFDSSGDLNRTIKFTEERVKYYREMLEDHIRKNPDFLSSLVPLVSPSGITGLIEEMYNASAKAGTGPMSAVAGSIAEYICNDIISEFGYNEVVVENGGDLFLKLTSSVTVSVYAGSSPLSEKIGLTITPETTPVSVCCSSGTVGHSLSFGTADACVIACRSGALADAFATAFCNRVKDSENLQEISEMALDIPEIKSIVIIKDDKVAIGGNFEIVFKE